MLPYYIFRQVLHRFLHNSAVLLQWCRSIGLPTHPTLPFFNLYCRLALNKGRLYSQFSFESPT